VVQHCAVLCIAACAGATTSRRAPAEEDCLNFLVSMARPSAGLVVRGLRTKSA